MQKAPVEEWRTISEQGARYEGFVVWINALVLSGGHILKGPEAGRDAVRAMNSEAGRKVPRS
jgi:multiple sugar transport system substrate-binding protein